MMIPMWALCALGAALVITTIPLIQERFRANGFALSVWIKVFMGLLLAPLIWFYGMPNDPMFYVWVGATCVLYSISDVVYYTAVPEIGSGLMTRLLPSAVVGTFLLWFVVDPGLIPDYFSNTWKAAAITATLAFFVFCATQIRKCPVSWAGVKRIWFVLFAAVVGPILTKKGLGHASHAQGLFGYLMFQSVTMLMLWSVYAAVKKPISLAELRTKNNVRTGFILACVGLLAGLFKFRAIQLVDNPAYVSMILFTDALWVLLVYRLIGRREQANVLAGLGIVFSAILIVLIKNWR